MISLDSDTFETNTFGFNLPCRQFVIAAERTKERRLPMVDEFILRTLLVVQSISADRLARFFGFEGRDLGISISDLQSRGLIAVDGDQLSLHPSAQEMFRTSSETEPTITVAEPLHADVWFDLVTKHMVSGRGLRHVPHLISIPTKQTLDEKEARTAFHDNFRDYLRIAKNDKNASQWSLYSILDVHAGRYSSVQIAGSETLSLQGAPKVECRLQLENDDRKGRVRQLTEAMAGQLSSRDHAAPSQAAFTDFARMFGQIDWARWFRPDGSFDLMGWFDQETRSSPEHTVPLLGYPYVERNRKEIASLLEAARLDAAGDSRWQLCWLRPGGSRWGATEDVPLTLEALRGVIRARVKGGMLSSTLVSPPSVLDKDATTFSRIFDRGCRAPAKGAPLALEVIVVANTVAVASVMVALSPTIHVPLGYATMDETLVQRIIEVSGVERLVRNSDRVWPQTVKG
jgi:hypothetical protein